MKEKKKEFDAVRMMREIREKLDLEIGHLSFDEQNRYVRDKLAGAAKKRRWRRPPEELPGGHSHLRQPGLVDHLERELIEVAAAGLGTKEP